MFTITIQASFVVLEYIRYYSPSPCSSKKEKKKIYPCYSDNEGSSLFTISLLYCKLYTNSKFSKHTKEPSNVFAAFLSDVVSPKVRPLLTQEKNTRSTGSFPELLDQTVATIATGSLHREAYDNTNTKFLLIYNFLFKH